MKIANLVLPNNVFLAPMAGVTDMPFRFICREMGAGLVYTEMVSGKGLYYENQRTGHLMDINHQEHPIGIQLFGSDPYIMTEIAQQLDATSADLIDINMGCPANKITRNQEGCALMKDLNKASAIISSIVHGCNKPVTVKFRKGWDNDHANAVEFAQMAQDSGASAITIHGRTREQFYSGKADWTIISQVKAAVKIPVIGNGDVFSEKDAKYMLEQTGCDGIMVARGAQGNPWIFKAILHYFDTGDILSQPNPYEKICMALKHTRMVIDYKGELNGIREMRKHISWYLKGINHSAEIKRYINHAVTWDEISLILNDLKETLL